MRLLDTMVVVVVSGFQFLMNALVFAMPMYVYQYVDSDKTDGERFEFLQGIRDEPLTQHPENGRPVRRVITACNINSSVGFKGKIERDLSDKNLYRLGFTKYVKSSDGQYKKSVGSGPETLSPGDAG